MHDMQKLHIAELDWRQPDTAACAMCVHHDPCGLRLQGVWRQLSMWKVLPTSGAERMLCWCRLAALLT